jgi:hypothetical protein
MERFLFTKPPPPRIGRCQATQALRNDLSQLGGNPVLPLGWLAGIRLVGERVRSAEPQCPTSDYTLVLAGMDFNEGPGFILLAGKGPAGELLLDSSCAIAAT